MNRWLGFVGVTGLVLTLAGVVAAFLSSFYNPLVIGHLTLGIIFLAVWVVSSGFKSLGDPGQIVKGRGFRFSMNAGAYVLIFVGLLAVVNWFAYRNDRRWDLTQEGLYSLSDQSQKVIKELKKPLKLVALDMPNAQNQSEDVEDKLKLFKYYNSAKVTTEIVDPRSKYAAVEQYGFKPGNLVYIEYGEGDSKAVSRINEASEEAVTNAIIKLTRGEAKKIYYVEGHSEPDMTDAVKQEGIKILADAIGDEHLTIESIMLAQKDSIPSDAAAIILASPQKNLLPHEKELLIKYVESGGRFLLLADHKASDDVKSMASHFGIKIGNDLIIDPENRVIGGALIFKEPVEVIVSEYGQHAITQDFKSNVATLFAVASSVRQASADADSEATKAATYTELVKSSASSWAETTLDKPTASKDSEDLAGPVSLAIAYEKNLDQASSDATQSGDAKFKKTARMVVFGDTDWVRNAGIKNLSNRDLILNTINWLVGEEGGISIRPKSIKGSTQLVLANQFVSMLVTSFIVIELILLFGLAVWWKRKTAA